MVSALNNAAEMYFPANSPAYVVVIDVAIFYLFNY